MRIVKTGLAALAATIVVGASAHAAEDKNEVEAPGTPESVWAMVGDFCAIKDWHPAVAECEEFEEGGDTFRILTLVDAGTYRDGVTRTGKPTYAYECKEVRMPGRNTTPQS